MPEPLPQATLDRLRAEAAAPYRSLRRFLYFGFGASAFIGAFVYFFRFLAGGDRLETGSTFLLQAGITAAMFALWRWEGKKQIPPS